jgi:hypothetical protein
MHWIGQVLDVQYIKGVDVVTMISIPITDPSTARDSRSRLEERVDRESKSDI